MKCRILLFLAMTFSISLVSCKHGSKSQQTLSSQLAIADQQSIDDRVENAENELNSSEAGKLLWQAMEAHGGLKKWYENGPISFRFYYQPLDGSQDRHTDQVVNTWNNTAVHIDVDHADAMFGWDGEQSWTMRNDTASFPYNTRFWGLTPIFFLGQPFIFDGEGVVLEKLVDEQYKGKMYDVVKVTYEDGTGDAPDDFYINYYSKETHRLEALRYIVSYPAYFEKGKHAPEKIMTLHDYQTIDGIVLPTRYETHWYAEDGGLGEHITDIKVSKIKFDKNIKSSRFAMPREASIMKDLK